MIPHLWTLLISCILAPANAGLLNLSLTQDKHLATITRTIEKTPNSIDTIGIPLKGGIGEFQISLKNPAKITHHVVYPNTMNLFDGFPAIGVYGNPYNFRSRLVLVELNQKALASVPENIRNVLSAPHTDLHILIHGTFANGATNTLNNLVFHGWASKLEGRDRFNIHVPMGIFNTNGVIPHTLAHNSLRAENVLPHDPCDLSPNNARFQIVNGRSVVSFWSVAQHKHTAAVTFHLLLTDSTMFHTLAASLEHAKTAADLINKLTELRLLARGEDQNTLEAARETITQLLLAGAN